MAIFNKVHNYKYYIYSVSMICSTDSETCCDLNLPELSYIVYWHERFYDYLGQVPRLYSKRKRKLDAKQISNRAYKVTSFLSTDCELSVETCSENVYSPGIK